VSGDQSEDDVIPTSSRARTEVEVGLGLSCICRENDSDDNKAIKSESLAPVCRSVDGLGNTGAE